MTFRKILCALSVMAALPSAFASNFVGGELGYETHPVRSSLTREQVRQEYLAFRAHPVLADGTVVLQGEAGHVSPIQGAFADRVPDAPHSHVLGNAASASPSPSPAALTDAERRAIREQYIN